MGELPRRVAILASGSGTTAEAYAQAIHDGAFNQRIHLVITNNPEAGILDRVERWNQEWGFEVETAVINRTTHPGGPNKRGQTQEEAEAITTLADEHGIDLIAAMGYMVIIKEPLISTYGLVRGNHRSLYEARMINTHPGPLPLTQDTIGEYASRRVLEESARIEEENKKRQAAGQMELPPLVYSEHTMHVISQLVDDPGTVFATNQVRIFPNDTAASLFQRVQRKEKAMIAYDIDAFLSEHARIITKLAAKGS
ncbi:MAG TPA: formyltransferase family protein [Candidatus Saccharimonadales bacterium]|nr:formyltransferase family protein [Candidatus Saccharimonadales bacterium]